MLDKTKLDKEIAQVFEYAEKLQEVKSVASGVNKADFKELLDLLEINILDCEPVAKELVACLSPLVEAKKSPIHEAPFNTLYKQLETMIADEQAEANGIVIVNPIKNKLSEIKTISEVVEGDADHHDEHLTLDETQELEDTEEVSGEVTKAFDNAFEVLQGELVRGNTMSEAAQLTEIFEGESVTAEDCSRFYDYMLSIWEGTERDVELDTLLLAVNSKKDSFSPAQAKELSAFLKRKRKTKEVFVYYAEKMIKCAEEAKVRGDKFKFDEFKKNHKSVTAAKDGDITRAEAIILYAERGFSRITTSTRLNFNLNSYDDYRARNYDNYAKWKADKNAGITTPNALEMEEKQGEEVRTEKDQKIEDLEQRLADTCKRLKIFNEVMNTMGEQVRKDFEKKVKEQLLAGISESEEKERQRLEEALHRKTQAKKHIELIKFGLRTVEDVENDGEYTRDELIDFGLPESYA